MTETLYNWTGPLPDWNEEIRLSGKKIGRVCAIYSDRKTGVVTVVVG